MRIPNFPSIAEVDEWCRKPRNLDDPEYISWLEFRRQLVRQVISQLKHEHRRRQACEVELRELSKA